MPEGKKRVYWDANVFLSYINRHPERIADLDAFFAEAAKPGSGLEIVTSVFSVVEVAFAAQEQLQRALDAETENKIDALWADSEVIKIVEFHEATALAARGLMRDAIQRGWQLKPNDAIHLATAMRLLVAEFHTYEPGLDKYAELIGRLICRPYVQQGQLGFSG